MKLNDIIIENSSLASFIDDWYSSHASIPRAQVDRLLSQYPDCVYNGYALRLLEVNEEEIAHWRKGNDLDIMFVNAYIADNEPSNRYVSGSASQRGMNYFTVISGTDPEYFAHLYVRYEVYKGLNLAKLAQRVQSSKAEQIAKIEEVLFIPENGQLERWTFPSK